MFELILQELLHLLQVMRINQDLPYLLQVLKGHLKVKVLVLLAQELEQLLFMLIIMIIMLPYRYHLELGQRLPMLKNQVINHFREQQVLVVLLFMVELMVNLLGPKLFIMF